MNEFITVDSVVKRYSSSVALGGISINFPRNGMIFIKGKSGSGKTTLLNLIGGLDKPTEGFIVFDKKNTMDFSVDEWDDYRNRLIGFIFQDYNLLDGFTVGENIKLPLDIQDELVESEKKNERVRETLQFVGLAGFENRKINELSGGQKQRVAIARAIAKQCKVILADEPTGNLDLENGKNVLDILKKVSKTRLVIIVTHDITSAIEYGDRIITISDGNITEDVCINRENKKKLYSIIVKDKDGNRVFTADKEKLDIAKTKLSDWLFNNVETHGFTVNIDTIEIVENNSESECTNRETEINSKKMPFHNSMSIAIQNLLLKKGRLACVMIMFGLTIFLLLMITFVLSYKSTKTISRYLSSQNITEVYLEKNESYENLFYDEISNNITNGESYYNNIDKLFVNAKMVPRYFIDSLSYEKPNGFYAIASDITLLITDDFEDINRELLIGRYPTGEKEIVITDYVANCMLTDENILNRQILVDSFGMMTVVGVIKTDYIEKEIPIKVKFNKLNEFENFDMQNIYQVAITSSSFFDEIIKHQNTMNIPASDYMLSEVEQRYIDSKKSFGTVDSIDGNIIYGRMPQNDNEVILSIEQARKSQITEDNMDTVFQFRDIYDEYFGKTYTDKLNLHDFFSDGIKVVGVYDIDFEDDGDILLIDQVYRNLIDYYAKYYLINDYMIIIDNCNIDEFVNIADNNGYMFNEPAVQKIYGFKETLNYLKIIIIFVFVVVMLITVFMLNSYISNNIKANIKKIGVLKSIGVTTKQIADIFVIEGVIISIFSYVLSCITAKVFIFIVNNKIVKQVKGHYFEYIYWNVGIAVLIACLTLVLCLLSIFFPIRRFAKKKPVELIRTIQ